jgi:hypothetical protein
LRKTNTDPNIGRVVFKQGNGAEVGTAKPNARSKARFFSQPIPFHLPDLNRQDLSSKLEARFDSCTRTAKAKSDYAVKPAEHLLLCHSHLVLSFFPKLKPCVPQLKLEHVFFLQLFKNEQLPDQGAVVRTITLCPHLLGTSHRTSLTVYLGPF